MRKLAIALATTAAVLAPPALARDGAWYVGGEFGGMIVEDSDFDRAGVEDQIQLDYDKGADGGLFVGYDLGMFRLEGEGAYKRARIDQITHLSNLPGGAYPGTRDAGGGHTTALSFMLNGLLDFGDEDALSGFVGAGVGWAKVDFNNLRAYSNQPAFLDDSDSRLAWQVFAGVRQAITDNIDVSVKYRWFNVEDVEMATATGLATNQRWRSHSHSVLALSTVTA